MQEHAVLKSILALYEDIKIIAKSVPSASNMMDGWTEYHQAIAVTLYLCFAARVNYCLHGMNIGTHCSSRSGSDKILEVNYIGAWHNSP